MSGPADEYNIWKVTGNGSDNVKFNLLVVGEFIQDAYLAADKPYDKWENLHESMGADA